VANDRPDTQISAYFYLSYIVLVDIRSHSYTSSAMSTKFINDISDAFHNLPLVLSDDPKKFDEKLFWEYVESFQRMYPQDGRDYKFLFNQKMNNWTNG